MKDTKDSHASVLPSTNSPTLGRKSFFFCLDNENCVRSLNNVTVSATIKLTDSSTLETYPLVKVTILCLMPGELLANGRTMVLIHVAMSSKISETCVMLSRYAKLTTSDL
ncbi:hypothetical protein WICPIJ_008288 [Wickerhamomyces pijperi]|uniref:Uncharacterized protein n=1 Tax=Wickerhamomyces pijperi TaxID=599730 RepID=A0A9P8Q074_WICPI|nr:hypothetical protein WICPIJ_008288 [Wickerhamomyces pijperi]